MKAWLSQQNVPFEVKDLLSTPPSREALAGFAKQTPGGVKEMVTPNTHFAEYQEHIAGKDLSDDQLLDLLAKVPNLLKKPVITDGPRILQGTKEPAKLAEFTGAART